MKKILFLIHDLCGGGAERVLCNLVNNLDKTKFDVTVCALFNVGTNKERLASHVKYKYCFNKVFRGNSKIMKLFSPKFLYEKFIKDEYDIVVSYLEGPCARIISAGKNVKKVCWIHVEQTEKHAIKCFRSRKEAVNCYSAFEKIVFVSNTVKDNFFSIFPELDRNKGVVLYNTCQSDKIIQDAKSEEEIDERFSSYSGFKVCSVAKIVSTKGYDRLARVHKRLHGEGYEYKIFILGIGEQKEYIEKYLKENELLNSFVFLGYNENPYKYVSKCDLYVCSSLREGFSTAVTESLIVGTPVLTTLCSGMEEMLGNNEYGLIVENSEEGIYKGLKQLLDDRELLKHYKEMANIRGLGFNVESTVSAVEDMLSLL